MAPEEIHDAVLSAFTDDGALFAMAATDGRIKIWDAGNGRLVTQLVSGGSHVASSDSSPGNPGGHLAVQLRCLAWEPKKDKKKKKKNYLAAGTAGGDVTSWDVTLGELRWRTPDCHGGGVATLVFSPDGEVLYSAGADGNICQIDASTGEIKNKFRASKRAVSCMAISPDGREVLAAGSEVKLFEAATQQRIARFAGHAAEVQAATVTPDGDYALSSAEGDRHVAVWPCPHSSTKENTASVGVLAMEDPAFLLACRQGKTDEDFKLQVLAVSKGGEAYFWRGKNIPELMKCNPVRVKVAASEIGDKGQASLGKSRNPILAGRIEESSGGVSLIVVRGSLARPHFERVKIDGASTTIVLPAISGGSLLPSSGTGKGAQDNVQETHVVSGETIQETIESKGAGKKKRKPDPKEDQDKDEKATETELVKQGKKSGMVKEQTLEEQLQALGILNEEQPEDKTGDQTSVAMKADSMQVLLRQALQAGDSQLLERCLQVHKPKVVSNTVSRLRPQEASKLLAVMVSRLHSRPSRAQVLIPWIRAVILTHASYLMSAPGTQASLASLFQIIEDRMLVMPSMLALSGRLDLLVSQAKKTQNDVDEAPIEDDSNFATAPVVYDDNDSEDEEVEDAMEGSSGSEEDMEGVEGEESGSEGEDGSDGDTDIDDGSDFE